ncbi:hypothetical protein TRIP_E160148 [uncultured Spirochaetota bacterium]|uniref:Uncharacterized protein n=1 Tax=uncultured Spirochaetota bacterium TaxID=460511 RepID=A0A652ZT19_9SPIR|nr:hypothetical protein TRIP_E160148 [uncultured Spirochaetota bacterium]
MRKDEIRHFEIQAYRPDDFSVFIANKRRAGLEDLSRTAIRSMVEVYAAFLKRLYVLSGIGNHGSPGRSAHIAPAQLAVDDMHDGMFEAFSKVMDDNFTLIAQKFLQPFGKSQEKFKINMRFYFHTILCLVKRLVYTNCTRPQKYIFR